MYWHSDVTTTGGLNEIKGKRVLANSVWRWCSLNNLNYSTLLIHFYANGVFHCLSLWSSLFVGESNGDVGMLWADSPTLSTSPFKCSHSLKKPDRVSDRNVILLYVEQGRNDADENCTHANVIAWLFMISWRVHNVDTESLCINAAGYN